LNDRNDSKINVAIDGPAGAGKSTIARLVANELGFVYVDTGAMYRVVTLKALQAGLQPHQHAEITKLAEQLNIELIPEHDGQQVLVDGEDVTGEIRSLMVNQHVSEISQNEQVRELLVLKQKKLASSKGVVMDGRDIATHVLPDSEVKIYLTASVEERANRRYKEMTDKSVTLKQLEREISIRDEADKQRKISPLVIANDAKVLDCTHLSISQVVDTILDLCRTKLGREQ
jgi:cytidylate kinase